MLAQKEVVMTWVGKNKEHFMAHGYQFTNIGDTFICSTVDLLPQSSVMIEVLCDQCGNNFVTRYKQYHKWATSNTPQLCSSCRDYNRIDSLYCKVLEVCNKKGYELLSTREDIENNLSIVRFACPVHGEQEKRVVGFVQDKGCWHCGRETAIEKMVTTTLSDRQLNLYEGLLKIADEKHYKIITPIQDIERNTDNIQYQCEKHGTQKARISNLLSGKGCPQCACEIVREKFSLTSDQVQNDIDQLGGVVLNPNEYVNNTTKNLRVICPCCKQNTMLTSLRNFKQHGGQVCDQCSRRGSSGERKIKSYLTEHGIQFEQEKWFSDCKDVKPLPFDFYLPDYNLLVEFDGEQHYTDRGYKNGTFKDTLEYTQLHDQIKNEYCLDNHIELLRIPYWDYNNIEIILEQKLSLHKDIV